MSWPTLDFLVILSNCCGTSCIKIQTDAEITNSKYSLKSPVHRNCKFILLLLTNTLGTYVYYLFVCKLHVNGDSVYKTVLTIGFISLNFLLLANSVVADKIHEKAIVKVLNDLNGINNRSMGRNLNRKIGFKIRNVLPYILIAACTASNILINRISLRITLNDHSNGIFISFIIIIGNICNVYLNLVRLVTEGCFLALIADLSHKFEAVNEGMEKTSTNESDIFDLKQFHNKIWNLVEKVNEISAFPLTINLMGYILAVVIASLELYVIFGGRFIFEGAFNEDLVDTLFVIMKVIAIADICAHCAHQAKRMKYILYQKSVQSRSTKIRKEVNCASLEILLKDYSIKAGTIGTLDYSFLFLITSAAAGYFVVNIQMATGN